MSVSSSPLHYPHSHLHSTPSPTLPNLREQPRGATKLQSLDIEAGLPSYPGASGLGFFWSTNKTG